MFSPEEVAHLHSILYNCNASANASANAFGCSSANVSANRSANSAITPSDVDVSETFSRAAGITTSASSINIICAVASIPGLNTLDWIVDTGSIDHVCCSIENLHHIIVSLICTFNCQLV